MLASETNNVLLQKTLKLGLLWNQFLYQFKTLRLLPAMLYFCPQIN